MRTAGHRGPRWSVEVRKTTSWDQIELEMSTSQQIASLKADVEKMVVQWKACLKDTDLARRFDSGSDYEKDYIYDMAALAEKMEKEIDEVREYIEELETPDIQCYIYIE